MGESRTTRAGLVGHLQLLRDRLRRLDRRVQRYARRQREVRASERLFRLLGENVPGVIYLCRNDQRYTMLYLNDVVEELTGYPKEDFFEDRISFVDLYHPDDAPAIPKQVDAALAGRRRFRLAYRLRHRDGSWRWVEEFGAGVFDGPRLQFLEGYLHDITEQRAAEADRERARYELEARVRERTADLSRMNDRLSHEGNERRHLEKAWRESEQRLRLIASNAPGLILQVDRALKICFINRTVAGLTIDQALGTSVFDWVPVESHDHLRANLEQVFATGAARTFEVKGAGPHGSVAWYQTNVGPVRGDEGVTSAVLSVHDITQRKEAEEALNRSEMQLRTVLAAMPDLLMVLDAEGRYRHIFTAEPGLLIRPPDELLGRTIHDVIEPAAAKEIQKVIADTLATGRLHQYEYALPIDGRTRWFAARVVRFGEPDEASVLWLSRDVTDRRQAEERARRRQLELAHVARLSTMGDMATGLAHELNQPLTAIESFAQGCRRRLERGAVDREELLDVFEQISDQARRAGGVIRHVRNFVRKREEHLAPVDLNEIAHNVVRFLGFEAREAMVEVQLELAPDLPPVMADGLQLEQVLLNLVRNALDALAQVDPALRRLAITSGLRACGRVEVVVRDTGPGIAAEDRERVFEPFNTSKSEGMGMGLTISRTIVESHGGVLWCGPNDGGGAVFQLRLPRCTAGFGRPGPVEEGQTVGPDVDPRGAAG